MPFRTRLLASVLAASASASVSASASTSSTLSAQVRLSSAAKEGGGIATSEIYRNNQSRVVQIRILDRSSEGSSSLGSGFFVSGNGLVMTNFHVVSELFDSEDEFRVELVRPDEPARPAELIDVDVVNDLAILKAEIETPRYFSFFTGPLDHGARLYSLGNPMDLGLTIVEGSYNGIKKDTFSETIHFTGAINSGMSGGPAIDGEGRVVGINVASSGNSVGFLVPSGYAERLLSRALGASGELDIRDRVRESLLEHQSYVTSRLLSAFEQEWTLGPYRVPAAPEPALRCWGDSKELPRYRWTRRMCRTRSDIYLSSWQRTGRIWIKHLLVSGNELNRFAFYDLYRSWFGQFDTDLRATSDRVTPFRCETGRVESNGIRFETMFCARAHRWTSGIYDFAFRAATLRSNHQGLQTEIVLSGFSFENGQKLAEAFLRAVQWKNDEPSSN